MILKKDKRNDGLFAIAITVLSISWLWNIVQLIECEKELNTCVLVHAIGLVPPTSLITVWYKDKS